MTNAAKKVDLAPDPVGECLAPADGRPQNGVAFRGWVAEGGAKDFVRLYIAGDEYFEFRRADVLHRTRHLSAGGERDDSTLWVQGQAEVLRVRAGRARELSEDSAGTYPKYAAYPKY